MKRFVLFGRWTARLQGELLETWRQFLQAQGVPLQVEASLWEAWVRVYPEARSLPSFSSIAELEGTQMAFVIGGDGAFLDAVRMVAPLGVPLVGVHAGRLGFLTDIPQERLLETTKDILAGRYGLELRTLLSVTTEPEIFGPHEAFALNEVAFSKALTGEMILVDVYLNGQLVNTYWADGVLVSTPTGSTAYSLACGGPILTPDCRNFVLTPIAPHSLTVRPLVLPDDGVLTVTLRSRTGQVQIAVDGRSVTVPHDTAVALRKLSTPLKSVKLPGHSYFRTLRDRLSWGIDRREGF